jgi:hypothetical protein
VSIVSTVVRTYMYVQIADGVACAFGGAGEVPMERPRRWCVCARVQCSLCLCSVL